MYKVNYKKQAQIILDRIKPKRKSIQNVEIFFRDEVVNLTLMNESIRDNFILELDETKLQDSALLFSQSIILNSSSFQKTFTSKAYEMFYSLDAAKQNLSDSTNDVFSLIKKIERLINKWDNAYKHYLKDLIKFFSVNKGFYYPLGCYPLTMISEPFFDHIKKDPFLESYTEDQKITLYLNLVKKIIDARFLSLDHQKNNEIRFALSTFIKLKNDQVSNLASEIRKKLFRYKGVKCPDHLIYISTLSKKEIFSISEFVIERYFHRDTSIESLGLALSGTLGVISNENQEAAAFYESNPFYSKPLKIRFRKSGYVAYLMNYLNVNGYLVQDSLWKSISRHNYFNTMRKDGTSGKLSQYGLSQANHLKHLRFFEAKNRSRDSELDKLHSFLETNFPNRAIT